MNENGYYLPAGQISISDIPFLKDYEEVKRRLSIRLWNLERLCRKKPDAISTNAIAKMGKGGDVSTQVLRKICEALDCKLEDIVDLDE